MKIYETDKDRIVELRKTGLSYRDIGKRFDCSSKADKKKGQVSYG